jgi:hypothetical protein
LSKDPLPRMNGMKLKTKLLISRIWSSSSKMKIHVKQSQILQAQTIIDQMVVRGVDYAALTPEKRC